VARRHRAIERVERVDPQLNAVIHPLFESARERAKGELPDGPFRGVPVLFKDLGCAVEGDPYHEGLLGFMRAAQFTPFTPIFNITGQPAISVPSATSSEGLPIGIHLVGTFGREDLLIRVAAQLENAAPWIDRRPAVHA
jgi:Asp-tRNA(Asn)/Glu-tRNA(Gln) amidotransferase A subunit family amidase